MDTLMGSHGTRNERNKMVVLTGGRTIGRIYSHCY